MITFILGLVIGLVVAWSVPMPQQLVDLKQKLLDTLRK